MVGDAQWPALVTLEEAIPMPGVGTKLPMGANDEQ